MNRTTQLHRIVPVVLMLAAGTVQAVEPANGTAIVRVGDKEYTIPIVCDDRLRPAAGVFTEPQRITRERTGRTSGIRLTIRPWKKTAEIIVSVDRYVAWIPSPASNDGILELSLAMSPASFMRDGGPVALTHEEWTAGNRPAGLDEVYIQANCRTLDPAAPGFRKLPAAG
jgi:hypothetical protein